MMAPPAVLRLVLIAALAAGALAGPTVNTPTWVAATDGPVIIDLGGVNTSAPKPSVQMVLAVQVCAGLYNRDASGPGVYTVMDKDDADWLSELRGITAAGAALTPPADFVAKCLAPGGPAKGTILFDYKTQQEVVPEMVTLAAVLDAVPVEAGDPALPASLPVAFDATNEWKGFSALQATGYLHDHHVGQTTGMAFLDPGMDNAHPLKHRLTGSPRLQLVDYMVKQRLFTFYLEDACIPLTKEHALMAKIAANNPWPRPVAVMGYNSAWNVAGGDLFEAETSCVKQHNMGQIASAGTNNLSYLSRTPAITTPMVQNSDPAVTFNASRTYISLIMGDGDNIDFMRGSRKDWLRDRLGRCVGSADPGHDCFPLLWSASPHLVHLAPEMIQWYYNKTRETQMDFFVLPPSGHLYAYPGEMGPDDQAKFVAATERDCELYSTSGTVAWEWFLQWHKAIDNYFPRYSAKGIVRGFFAVNVPFMLPVFAFGKNEFFKVLGEKQNVVLFRPREWRGTGGKIPPLAKNNYLTPAEFAAEVNGYAPGTVTAVYLTSDGGGGLGDVYDMVKGLGEHVEIVNHNAVVDMALASHAAAAATGSDDAAPAGSDAAAAAGSEAAGALI